MKAIITGATKGIGRALAEKFAAEGFDLAVCARTATDLDNLRAQLSGVYPTTEIITEVADLSEKADCLRFAQTIERQWGAVDVLINNAGAYTPGNVSDEPDGALERMIGVNLYSAYHLTRGLLPLMVKRGAGHIFNMCSVASLRAFPNGGAYSIAKFALYGMSQNLREETKTSGIKVTSILPGATWSASWEGVDLPESRLMQAEDIAHAVFACYQTGPSAVVEDLIIRPQLGDL